MGIVTSNDTDSGKAAAAKTVGSAALGYLLPWTRPARVVVNRVRRRRATTRLPKPVAVTSLRPSRRTSRLSGRTGLVILGIGGVIGGGVVFSTIRHRNQTPAPVAAQPPRIEDVPTR